MRRSPVLPREGLLDVRTCDQRLGDRRRQVRLYGRTQDQVYPTGAFFKNGNYGTKMPFPVPDRDKANPQFTGCIDQNP